jgi:apolipoprotein N-acyltransferase
MKIWPFFLSGLVADLMISKRNIMLALLSGLLLFFSFPKYGNGWIAWIALIPLFFAIKEASIKESFRIAFLAGFAAHIGLFYWIAFVVVQYGNLPVYAGIAAMLLLSAYLSLYTAGFAAGIVFLKGRGAPLWLSAPLLWTALEYLRAHLMTGFPWASLGYSQYLHLQLIQISDVTGIYGISFAIVLINAVLFDFISEKLRGRSILIESAAAVLIILLIFLYGHFRMNAIDALLKKAPDLEVSLIQGNIDQNMKWNTLYQTGTIEIYRSLSGKAIPSAGGLIVWPETAAPFYFQRPGPMREAVLDIARTTGSTILLGSPSYKEENGNTRYMNSAFLLRPDGIISGQYDKVHLVPYGEYVPLRALFPFMSKITGGIGDFQSGKGYFPLTSEGRRLGVLICYEGIFPEAARNYKREKAELLVNITNDAWFGRSSAPYQHLSMTIYRAIENRLTLVRAANTGISAIIDQKGEILSRTGLFERTYLKGAVKIIDVNTFYAAYGDLFVWLCAGALFIVIIYAMQRRK